MTIVNKATANEP